MQQFDLLIVGGGSAGWMAAALCSRLRPQWRIALVESERIGTIGVGEGSTPHFGRLMATLGLAESLWMPECDASFKTGIDFGSWGGDEQRYFHPFLSPMDLKAAEVFYLGANARRRGRGPWTGPDEYFIAARLARAGVDPIAAKPLPRHWNTAITSMLPNWRCCCAGWPKAQVCSVSPPRWCRCTCRMRTHWPG